jgi:hypothetical protein
LAAAAIIGRQLADLVLALYRCSTSASSPTPERRGEREHQRTRSRSPNRLLDSPT